MKKIRFDLNIDGVKVKSIEELRNHFTFEIIDHYRSGRLARWLSAYKMQKELDGINSLNKPDDYVLLKSLSDVFCLDIDDAGLAKIVNAKKESVVSSYGFSADLETERNNDGSLVNSDCALTSSGVSSGQSFFDISENEIRGFLVEDKIDELKEKIKGKRLETTIQEILFNCELEIARVILAETINLSPVFAMDLAKKGTPKVRESLGPVIKYTVYGLPRHSIRHHHASRMHADANWTPARKFRASLS